MDVLLALPASALTTLEFSYVPCSHRPPPIARFTKLQHLALRTVRGARASCSENADSDSLPAEHTDTDSDSDSTSSQGTDPGCASMEASTYGQLAAYTTLTSLTLKSITCDRDVSLLPGQLQQLDLIYNDGHPTIHLQHLTALRNLQIVSDRPAVTSLPTQLQELTMSEDRESVVLLNAYDITSLQQLRHLYLNSVEFEPLHLLGTLKQLSSVVCFVRDLGRVQCAASVWGQLPELCNLEVFTNIDEPAELDKVVNGIAAATRLTSLEVAFDLWRYDFTKNHKVESIYKQLSQMTQLCSLSIDLGHDDGLYRPWSRLPEISSMGPLSSLNGLTKLVLVNTCHDGSAADMSRLLSCLSRLEKLYVDSSFTVYWRFDMLPLIGQLQRLRSLTWRLGDIDQPTRRRLKGLTQKQLSGLTRLTELS